MRTSRLSLLALTCAFAYLATAHGRHGEISEISAAEENQEGPWFTGPLLTPSGHVVPIGYFDFEPYVFFTDTFARYNENWHAHSIPEVFQINPLLLTQIGLTQWMDFQISPQMFYTKSQGKSATGFGDLPILFDLQLLNDPEGSWWPAIKLVLREAFPTGKYQKLDPKKNGVDATGLGAYTSSVGI